MTEIISCKEYNQRGYTRYRKAVERYKSLNNYTDADIEGGFPFLGFYIFEKPNGEPRKYGYVLSTEIGGQWFKTKKQAYKKEFDARATDKTNKQKEGGQ
jgi:hypothetical protein